MYKHDWPSKAVIFCELLVLQSKRTTKTPAQTCTKNFRFTHTEFVVIYSTVNNIDIYIFIFAVVSKRSVKHRMVKVAVNTIVPRSPFFAFCTPKYRLL